MNKSIMWVLSIIGLIGVNVGAIPIAIFSMFDTAEGTSIFSFDYALAFGIIVAANLVVAQMIVATVKGQQSLFVSGLVVAVVEVALFTMFYSGYVGTVVMAIVAALIVIASIVLLVKTIRQ